MEDTFNKAYERLNKKQKEAVDTLEGPVMVIAGPGTGKTQILTLRIANILKQTDTPPSGILAITFTESAAAEMKHRLREMIGKSAYKLNITTFHALCESIIDEFPEYFPRIGGGELIDDVERVAILRSIFDKNKLAKLKAKNSKYNMLGNVSAFIKDAKRESVDYQPLIKELDKTEEEIKSASDFIHTTGPHKGKVKGVYKDTLVKIERSRDVALVYKEYETHLIKHNKYDFEDILIETVSALKEDEDFKKMIQERYLYILADEHQDTNRVQDELLILLSDFHDNPNIFIVGDEKQAIYRFQGAMLDTFISLKERYRDTKVIVLEENYRSTQKILDTAHELIGESGMTDMTMRPRLNSNTEDGKQISLLEAENENDEVLNIVSFIKERIGSGYKPEDIAILVRKNKDATAFSNALSAVGVAHNLKAKDNILEHPLMKIITDLLKAITEDGAPAKSRAMFIPGSGVYFKDGELQGLREFESKLEALRKECVYESAIKCVHKIIKTFSLNEEIFQIENGREYYEVLDAFISDVENMSAKNPASTISDYLERIDMMIEHRIPLGKSGNKSGVSIMTIHSAKGMEFDVVIIPGVTQNAFGKGRSKLWMPGMSDNNELEDERRILYVALTRAKKEALITYPQNDANDRSLELSGFVAELGEMVGEYSGNPAERQFEIQNKSFTDLEFIRERLLKYGISASAFKDFYTSPWTYFFKYILRIKSEPEVPLIYGSAVHKALEVGLGDSKVAKEVFRAEMDKSIFRDREDLIEKGEESLNLYLEHIGKQNNKTLFKEKTVKEIFEVSGIPPVYLNGKLDRVDEIDGEALIIDYKTGAAKSENAILGKTKDSDNSYYLQLMFYGALLDMDDSINMPVATGRISFVEPNNSGKIVERDFQISKEEIERTKEQIKEMITSVYNGDFLKEPCDEGSCEYCYLANFINQIAK